MERVRARFPNVVYQLVLTFKAANVFKRQIFVKRAYRKTAGEFYGDINVPESAGGQTVAHFAGEPLEKQGVFRVRRLFFRFAEIDGKSRVVNGVFYKKLRKRFKAEIVKSTLLLVVAAHNRNPSDSQSAHISAHINCK